MREAYIGNGKQRVSRLHRSHANFAGSHKRVPRDDLLCDRHPASWLFRGSFEPRRRYFTCHSCFVVVEESAVFDDVLRNRIKTACELFEWNLLAATNAFD